MKEENINKKMKDNYFFLIISFLFTLAITIIFGIDKTMIYWLILSLSTVFIVGLHSGYERKRFQ